MTLAEFERAVFATALHSPLCAVPLLQRLTVTSISLRIPLTNGALVDAFYNEQTGTTAFALILNEQRIFGADNTGGWHVHPFAAPDEHRPLPQPWSFADFMTQIEHYYGA